MCYDLRENAKGGEKMVDKSRLIEEYEVNPQTMMLQPIEYGSKIFTKIFELDHTLLSPFRPFEIVKKSCEYFGSSYEGRKEGTKQLTGIYYKAPIIVDPHTSIYLFPTTSPTKQECFWLSHKHIHSHHSSTNGETVVTFTNRKSYMLPISNSSFETQLMRTSRLQYVLSQRIHEMESRYKPQESMVSEAQPFQASIRMVNNSF